MYQSLFSNFKIYPKGGKNLKGLLIRGDSEGPLNHRCHLTIWLLILYDFYAVAHIFYIDAKFRFLALPSACIFYEAGLEFGRVLKHLFDSLLLKQMQQL